jgi:hypothetical protein
MAYPGGRVAIVRPAGFQDIESVDIVRVVNDTPETIGEGVEWPYTDSSTEEGAVRIAKDSYSDLLPEELLEGDEIYYTVTDVYSEESFRYPETGVIVLTDVPESNNTFSPASVRGYGYAKRY